MCGASLPRPSQFVAAITADSSAFMLSHYGAMQLIRSSHILRPQVELISNDPTRKRENSYFEALHNMHSTYWRSTPETCECTICKNLAEWARVNLVSVESHHF